MTVPHVIVSLQRVSDFRVTLSIYSNMVTVLHVIVSLQRMSDYRGFTVHIQCYVLIKGGNPPKKIYAVACNTVYS